MAYRNLVPQPESKPSPFVSEGQRLFSIMFKNLFIYLAVSGPGCWTWNLHCIVWNLSLWLMDSLLVTHGLQSAQASLVVPLYYILLSLTVVV